MRPYRNYFREFYDNVNNCRNEIIGMFNEFGVREITMPKIEGDSVLVMSRTYEDYIYYDHIDKIKLNGDNDMFSISVVTDDGDEFYLDDYFMEDILSMYDEVYAVFDDISNGTKK